MESSTDSQTSSSRPRWLEAAAREAWEIAQKRLQASRTAILYSKYQQDPMGFITEILGERLTVETQRVVESVRDNPVTIAQSANAIGKSFSAARIASAGSSQTITPLPLANPAAFTTTGSSRVAMYCRAFGKSVNIRASAVGTTY